MNAVREADVLVDDFERDARALEGEKLSRQARAALKRIRAQMSRLRFFARESLNELQEVKAFSPEEAGRRVADDLKQAEGGAYTGTDLRAKWSLSAAVLHRRRKERRIVYWRDARHEFHYPVWQLNTAGALLPGIQEILQIFESSDEWRVMGYFLSPRRQLGNRRPLDLLREDKIKDAMAHAQLHAEENTW
jgi:hypothetical protein